MEKRLEGHGSRRWLRTEIRGSMSAWALAIMIVAVWWFWPQIMSAFIAPRVLTPSSLGAVDLGPIGDMFGALNTLFAGAAFFGVAVAAWWQAKTSRSSLEMQRLAEFEPLFFQLLGLFRDLQANATVDHVAMGLQSVPVTSPRLAEQMRRHIASMMVIEQDAGQAAEDPQLLYERAHKSTAGALDPMFHVLEELLQLTCTANVTCAMRARYSRIAAAVLSDDFLLFVKLRCASGRSDQLLRLLLQFDLLDRHPPNADHSEDRWISRWLKEQPPRALPAALSRV
jgi:hypothetical protein